MKSGACSETSSTVSVFFLFFLLLSPVFSTINFKHANKTFESKKMKSIKATLGKNNKRFVKSIKVTLIFFITLLDLFVLFFYFYLYCLLLLLNQSPDGDVIDCVLFHLQPAFDKYPMLKTTMPMVYLTCFFICSIQLLIIFSFRICICICIQFLIGFSE